MRIQWASHLPAVRDRAGKVIRESNADVPLRFEQTNPLGLCPAVRPVSGSLLFAFRLRRSD